MECEPAKRNGGRKSREQVPSVVIMPDEYHEPRSDQYHDPQKSPHEELPPPSSSENSLCRKPLVALTASVTTIHDPDATGLHLRYPNRTVKLIPSAMFTGRCQRSLYIFDESSPTRERCVLLLRWPWFERIVLLLIVLNALLQAMHNYREPEGGLTKFVEGTEHVFTFLFLGELVVKVIALGLIVDQKAYLRDPWSWLDTIVVVSGLISLMFSSLLPDGGINVLRTIRVLRPLRSFSRLQGLRAIVKTFLLSLPRLGNVAGMFLFLLVIFGILGLNFYGGTLHRYCRLTPRPLVFWNSAVLDPVSDAGLMAYLRAGEQTVDVAKAVDVSSESSSSDQRRRSFFSNEQLPVVLGRHKMAVNTGTIHISHDIAHNTALYSQVVQNRFFGMTVFRVW